VRRTQKQSGRCPRGGVAGGGPRLGTAETPAAMPPAEAPVCSYSSRSGAKTTAVPVGRPSKALNPDISVIGDFVGRGGRQSGIAVSRRSSLFLPCRCTNPRSACRRLLILMPGATSLCHLGKKGVDLEEGLHNLYRFARQLRGQSGKKCVSAFGKVNTMHKPRPCRGLTVPWFSNEPGRWRGWH